MEESGKSLEPRMLAEMVRKRKWLLILPVVVVVAGSIAVIEMLPSTYRVESVLLFEDRASLSGDVKKHLLPENRPRRAEDEGDVLRHKLLSPGFLGDVAEQMGMLDNPEAVERARARKALTGDPKSPEEIVRDNMAGWFRSMIEVHVSGSDLYQVTLEGHNPRLIYDLANGINSQLITMVHEEQLSRIQAASEFTKEQIEIYKKNTDDARRALQRFLDSIPLDQGTETAFTIDPAKASRLGDETRIEILRIQDRLNEARNTLARVYSFQLDAFVDEVMPRISLQMERLNSLEKQLGYLLLERSWSDPTVISHNTRIGETRTEMEGLIRRIADGSLAGRPSGLREIAVGAAVDHIQALSLNVRLETLQQQAMPGAALVSPRLLARRQQQLDILQEQVRLSEEIYQSFVRQATATQISEAVETEQLSRSIQVIQTPRWPTKPVWPNRLQMYALAPILGIALGVVLVLLGEYLDTSVKDVHEAEELMGVPILGTIPRIEHAYTAEAHGRVLKKGLLYLVGGIVAVALVSYFLYRSTGDEAVDPAEGSGSAAAAAAIERG